jgi:hypothetical protein
MIDIVKIKTGEYGEKPLEKVRLFIHNPNEHLMENLTNRHCRPWRTYLKEVVPMVKIEQMIAANVKASWSQYAGCSCGCSPGFILDIHPVKTGYEAIWVTVK